jgi:hypothetical protein
VDQTVELDYTKITLVILKRNLVGRKYYKHVCLFGRSVAMTETCRSKEASANEQQKALGLLG